MRESQYIDRYLDHATRYTVGSFLAITLKGRAKHYAIGYQRALQRAINRRLQDGTAEPCASVRGARAYRRVSS